MLIIVKNTDEGTELYNEDLKLICVACNDEEHQMIPSVCCSLGISEEELLKTNPVWEWCGDMEEAKRAVQYHRDNKKTQQL